MFKEKNKDLEELKNVDLIYSDSGRVVMTLTADSMLINRSTNEEFESFPSGVNAVIYDANQNIVSYLDADRAIRNVVDKTITAEINVVLRNNEGDTLKTERLTFDEETGELKTNHFVRISTPDETIYGFGFKTNKDFDTYEIYDISGSTTMQGIQP